jgi:hypothetical protein
MQQRPRETTDGARETEPEQHAPVDMPTQFPESDGAPDQMRYRDAGYGELGPGLERQDRREQAADAEARHGRDAPSDQRRNAEEKGEYHDRSAARP